MRPLGAKPLNHGGEAPRAPQPDASRNSRELLFDSEAILRLVDGALTDLRVATGSSAEPAADEDLPTRRSPASLELAEVSGSIKRLLEDLRSGRNELPARRLQNLYGDLRLEQLSSATAMLDRLGKALVLVDRIEAGTHVDGDSLGHLRHELFSLMNCLQFHSETVDRLNRASALLAQTESRLAEIADTFEALRPVSTESTAGTAEPIWPETGWVGREDGMQIDR